MIDALVQRTTRGRDGGRPALSALFGPSAFGLFALFVGAIFALTAYSVHLLAVPAVLLVVGLAVVSLSRPEMGVAVAFLLLSLNSGLVATKPWVPGTAWTAFLVVASLTRRREDGLRLPAVGAAGLAFGLVAVLGVLISGNPGAAAPVVRSIGTGMGLLFVISNEARTRQQAQWVISGIVGAGAVVGGYATWQFLRGSRSAIGFITDTGELVSRVTAGFTQPNQMAGFLILVLPLAVGGALLARRRRALYLLAALVSTVGIYASFSRGALLALVVVPLVFLGTRRVLLLTPLVVLAFMVATPSLLEQRFATAIEQGSEVAVRMDFWRTAASLWADKPIFGVGPGGFGEGYAEARVPGKRFLPDTTFEPPQHAHNLELNLLAEQGIVGLVSFAVVFGLALRDGVRLRRSSRRYTSVVATSIVASLSAFAVHNQVDVTLLEGTGTYFWAMLGLLGALTVIDREERSYESAV